MFKMIVFFSKLETGEYKNKEKEKEVIQTVKAFRTSRRKTNKKILLCHSII